MIALTASTPILLALEAVDFRLGIDGMATRCQSQLSQDPFNGTVFVFINRRRTMIRALVYEHNGFWLMTKRLSRGRFAKWPTSQESTCPVLARDLRQILSGAHWQNAD